MKNNLFVGTFSLLVFLTVYSTYLNAKAHPESVGPHSVQTTFYNHGDQAFSPPGFSSSVEVVGKVYHPSDLSAGPFPLVIFMHGRHSTCFSGSTAKLQWPCSSDANIIPSYEGYDYIGSHLASHGYIVVSIGANGINAFDNSSRDRGMSARARLIDHHLQIWEGFNRQTSAEFGALFIGKVDMARIGTMGHSRGGEGVASHYVFNAGKPQPYNVKAVLPLAPTDFNRHLVDNVNLGVLLPYCDGDVSDLQGIHYYDDALYTSPTDSYGKYNFLVMGANHNYFNTVWTPGEFVAGTSDDAMYSWNPNTEECGVNAYARLTAADQRAAGKVLVSSFFRAHLGKEKGLLNYLRGEEIPSNMTAPTNIRFSFHAPTNKRLDINRFDQEADKNINELGGAVTQSDLSLYDVCGESLSDRHCIFNNSYREPHTTFNSRKPKLGLAQIHLRWFGINGYWVNSIPSAYSDFSPFDYLSFRAGSDVQVARGQTPDIQVELRDASGNSEAFNVALFSNSLDVPGDFSSKVFLSSVRIPLNIFKSVNLSNITEIRFKFDDPTIASTAGILISDMALTRGGAGLIKPQVLPLFDDFEGNVSWKNTGQYTWYQHFGGTPSPTTGPSTGAQGTSYYMYMETSNGSAYSSGDSAFLESKTFVADDTELSFYYHMYGNNTGRLVVDIFVDSDWKEIWSKNGQQHNSDSALWTKSTVSLNSYYGNVKLRFRGIAAGGYRGDMAIDQVEIKSIENL